ncbi:sister chromatid cohesion protein PDS5 homolog D-like isoform X2 [Brassica napus]|uniref:sister chromatid cohesion protein PDS5 homolog D-like isoform X2 n=1 Tax=Brassica napus TaxID=3708 RepID=UPI002079005A|nr:sister chromatid cohesion protein PDS5 homolog D-like isoform X2 [Brassica napus]
MASSIVGLTDLARSLIDAGNRLLKPPPSADELLALLNETESLLRDVGQGQPLSMQHALIPSKNALVSSGLLTHPDSEVRVSLASCLTEIVRITAPRAPYGDDQMKEIFRLTVEAFEKLADASSSRSYGKAEFVLDIVSRLNSCLVMLDLECDDLVLQMFRIFLRVIRSDHPSVVPSSMEMIMITVIDETDEVSKDLMDTLLTSVKKENKNVSPMSWSLAEKVLSRCARTLQPYIIKALKSTGTSFDLYSPVVSSICQTVFETPKVHNAVNTKDNEDKLGSKRPAREGTIRISGSDKVRKGHSLKQEVQCEGKIDALKTCSNKKLIRASPSSLGKVAARKTPPALTGSVKRSRVSICESDHDSDSPSSSEEDERKINSSSKKKKKPVFKPKGVNSSGKRSSARSDTKKKKKKSYTDEFGEGLVGQRVNIWWPLDKTFYGGVIMSYCSSKKKHLVLYTDGVTEQLNLIKERWELLEDLTSSASEQDMESDLVKKSGNTSPSAIRSSSRPFVKKDSGKAREAKNLKSLNAETDRREEQEDVDSQSEDEYYNSEKQEQSRNKSAESLKVADREEKEDPRSETESEREGSESKEPKWRETENTGDEAEEVDDDKVRSTRLRETEKDADEDRES